MHPLAIVIPAYKLTFFERTISSIAYQTCKNFTLYVGNDNSCDELGVICEKYAKIIDIVYHRFNDNLGGKDLVEQWKRCIELTKGEPWIWLFSDDDIMGESCVELFFSCYSSGYDIFHFDVKIINDNDKVIYLPKLFPKKIYGRDLFVLKQSAKLDSFVVEYVFSRRIYEQFNGFQNFPMAWGSDIATWVKFAGTKGIRTILGDNVYWRQSCENITPKKGRKMAVRKIYVEIDYLVWANNYFNRLLNAYCSYFFIRSLTFYSPYLSYQNAFSAIRYARKKAVITTFLQYVLITIYPLIRLAKNIKRWMIINYR